jgi:hypothetical protein
MDANFSDLQQVLRLNTGIAFRLHDLRRAAVSAMAERGVDFAVADAILNHATSQSRGGMLGVYQHAELKPAKRRAMEIWEAALFPQTADVVPLRGFVITSRRVDPTGDLAVAVAEKYAELDGKGLARRRRPPDVAFDEELLKALAAKDMPLGLTEPCIQTAVKVARRLGKTLSRDSARWRIAELQRRAKEKSADDELSNLPEDENM